MPDKLMRGGITILTSHIEIIHDNVEDAIRKNLKVCQMAIRNKDTMKEISIVTPTQYFIDNKERLAALENYIRDVVIHNTNFTMVDQLISIADFDKMVVENEAAFELSMLTLYFIADLFVFFGHQTMTQYILQICKRGANKS